MLGVDNRVEQRADPDALGGFIDLAEDSGRHCSEDLGIFFIHQRTGDNQPIFSDKQAADHAINSD